MAYWFLNDSVSMDAVLELSTEKPRAAAVVGAAITDTVLTSLLLQHFRDGQTKKELFNPAGGRLGDYDTKTKIAYLLGMVSKQAAKDMSTIGQIRNRFAHRLDINSFDHIKIASLCNDLKLIETHIERPFLSSAPSVSLRFHEPNIEEKLADAKSRFILSVKIITNALINRPDDMPKPFLPHELI